MCDYVVNLASGCIHGCTFCYVPATPAIRTKQASLAKQGIDNPQMDWGRYLLVRNEVPTKLEGILSRKRVWNQTPAGKGVVLLCSGTDPYQNAEISKLTRETVKVLIKYGKRIRILTRSPLWINDLDILVNPNVTVGMSLPHLNNKLSKQIEPFSPLPTARYQALQRGKKAGCRIYVAVAPTPPQLNAHDFFDFMEKISVLEPEVIFWEPINARGTNGKRMVAAGLNFAKEIMNKDSWASNFLTQWAHIEEAAAKNSCSEKLHIWPDRELAKYVAEPHTLHQWIEKPTIEAWPAL